MTENGAFCDTSFFIRLLDKTDPLHINARNYYQYLLENNKELYISTIAVAEYCVGGRVDELPFKNLKIVPFNLHHAERAGELAQIVFRHKNKLRYKERNIIPNDTKLFAQSDLEKQAGIYLSSDSESLKIYRLLNQYVALDFRFADINTPYDQAFGVLRL